MVRYYFLFISFHLYISLCLNAKFYIILNLNELTVVSILQGSTRPMVTGMLYLFKLFSPHYWTLGHEGKKFARTSAVCKFILRFSKTVSNKMIYIYHLSSAWHSFLCPSCFTLFLLKFAFINFYASILTEDLGIGLLQCPFHSFLLKLHSFFHNLQLKSLLLYVYLFIMLSNQ